MTTRMTTPAHFQVGIIGFGKMGKLHADAYERVGATVKWVLDANAVSKDCTYAVTDNMDVVLRDCDIISICSPSSTHVAVAEQSFRAKVHTFIEKPLALNADDCRNLVHMHKQSGLSFRAGVGHIERFNAAFQVLLENIRKVGTLESIRAVRTNPSSGRIADADVVSDLMVHDLDLMRAICGGTVLERVHISHHVKNDKGVLDSVTIQAVLNKIKITATACRINTAPCRTFTVQGGKGRLSADLRNCTILWTSHMGDTAPIPVQPCDQITSQIGAWVTAVTNATKPIVGLTDGLFAVRACDTVRQAVSQVGCDT